MKIYVTVEVFELKHKLYEKNIKILSKTDN